MQCYTLKPLMLVIALVFVLNLHQISEHTYFIYEGDNSCY